MPSYAPALADTELETERVEAMLRHRLQLEELLTRLSGQFINVSPSGFGECLDNALRAVGEFTGVDRIAVILAAPDDSHLTILQGWSREATWPEIESLARIELSSVPWWETLRQGRIVAVPSVRALPETPASGKAMLSARGHRAVIMVPIQSRQRAVGFLTLACLTQERDWDDDTVSMLRMVGEVFSNALERRRIEDSLRSSEERFRALIEHSEDSVSLFDRDGLLLYTSPSGVRVYGTSEESQIGKSLWEFIHPDDRDKVETLVARLLESPGVPVRARIRRPAGTGYLWLDITATNWLDNAAIGAFVVNTRDVTAQVEAEQKIHRLNEDLERRVRERTADLQNAVQEMKAFSYSVSHDLRGPLRVIAGYSNLIHERLDDSLDEDSRTDLVRIENSARHMSQLIDGLLALSRLSRETPRRQSVDLSELARGVLDSLRHEDPTRGVDVVLGNDCIADGDRRLLEVLLENLLGNAWKYTARTSGARIELGSSGEGADKVFFVRDNGAGFEMSYVSKLFRAFSRLHSAAEFEGVGIGLAIVHRIVQRHGGQVWAVGEPGRGATFYFTLGLRS